MKLTLLALFVTSITKIESKIAINIHSDSVTYSGEEIAPFTIEDFNGFNGLKEEVKNIYDLSTDDQIITYLDKAWSHVQKVTTIKSAVIKSVNKRPLILMTQDLDNTSNLTIKANAGISYTVEETLSTSWFANHEIAISQEIEYGIILVTGRTTFAYTATWGKNEEISKSVTLGSTSAVEIELKPGERATAELSVTAGEIEIEMTYEIQLRGYVDNSPDDLVIPFYVDLFSNSFVFHSDASVLYKKTVAETIKLDFNVDANLKVSDGVGETSIFY